MSNILTKKKPLFGLYAIAISLILVNSAFAAQLYYRAVFIEPRVAYNVEAWVKRAGDTEWQLVSVTHNIMTNGGLDFVKTQLGTAANASLVDDISLSTSASSPAATWHNIPSEITNNGLERASGIYNTIGTGNWKVFVTFNATGTHTNVQLTGISWVVTANGGALFACATITAVTLQANDQLKITWTFTVS
jgi:hypothetical protein